MNYIEYHGEGITFEENEVPVKDVRQRFGITKRKSMFLVNSNGLLTRHLPDYIDFSKKDRVVIEAISDFELG